MSRSINAATSHAPAVPLALCLGCVWFTQGGGAARRAHREPRADCSLGEELNPLLSGGMARWPTANGVFEPLMIFNPMAGEHVPWLATAITWVDGTRVLEVQLREGVVWSDGEAFDADDMAFTLRLIKEQRALDGSGLWTYAESAEQVGSHTIRLTFKKPYAPGRSLVGGLIVVPEHIWSTVDDPVRFANPDPVATGPFTEVLASIPRSGARPERAVLAGPGGGGGASLPGLSVQRAGHPRADSWRGRLGRELCARDRSHLRGPRPRPPSLLVPGRGGLDLPVSQPSPRRAGRCAGAKGHQSGARPRADCPGRDVRLHHTG